MYRITSKQRRGNLSNHVCDFTDKSPGQINQKGQLICEHPGPRKPWNCYRCKEQLATNKLFEDHSRKVNSLIIFFMIHNKLSLYFRILQGCFEVLKSQYFKLLCMSPLLSKFLTSYTTVSK